ncbi:MAG: fumarate hydratase [Acidobacteriota bacterium]|nr:fumarate hydratase [Acidobacteriota bacterium]
MADFQYEEMFSLGADSTEYRRLTSDFVNISKWADREMLRIDPEGLTELAAAAMDDVSFLFRTSHLAQLRAILDDPEASDNDRFVALELLKNANISASRVLPSCQDTGTAIVMAHKGEQVITGADDAKALARGIYKTYQERNLRYSQNAPIDMYTETNTGTNLPAQIEIEACQGSEYRFLFLAKGGGSANKTFLFQETKALLNPESLQRFVADKLFRIGTAACPPYHLALVIGGTSAELTLKTVKLASARYLDSLPANGNELGRAFRDRELEETILDLCRRSGIGAQFGGKYFAHDVRVIRLPRHGASCPVGLGVSCSADRQILAKVTGDGLFLERLEDNPARYLPDVDSQELGDDVVRLDLDQPMTEIRTELAKHPVSTRLSLTGPLIVARDIAHAKLKQRLDDGGGLPAYIKDHIVYYAGPAKKPAGLPSGSFGPTTAGRMDSYVELFQSRGGSLVMLAKGNRSAAVTQACRKNGGFYLGSIGGPAARLAKDCIKSVEVLEFPELGMEAVWKIQVENFPAFVVVDDKGNDFYADIAANSLLPIA